MSFVIILCLIVYESSGLSPLDYDIRKGNNLTDSEKYNDIEIPKEKYKFKSFTEGATYLGLMFAGKSEFPWIVDVRVHQAQPEEWSTGNLLSAKHVLTTCRAMKFLMLGGTADVTYFMQFVWEHDQFGSDERNAGKEWPKRLGGRVKVASFILHRKCSERTLSYDIGCMVLETPIDAYLPFIAYMPLQTDRAHPGRIPNVRLETMEIKRQICLVGSVGRSYLNVKDHLVRDFKVRFRVYWEPWKTCSVMMSKLCDSHIQDCRSVYPAPDRGRDWVCMRTRARVGTVCDHDRGAPLVCDDEVVGIVVFGALLDYCNDRFPMPFIVSKLNKYQHFIMKHLN